MAPICCDRWRPEAPRKDIMRELFLLLVLVSILVVSDASAQSTWKPTTAPKGTKPYVPKIENPIVDPMRLDKSVRNDVTDKNKVLSTHADSMTSKSFLEFPVNPVSSWQGVLPERRLPDDQGGLPVQSPQSAADLRYSDGGHSHKKSAFCLGAAVFWPRLTAFNDIFLAEELNQADQRNHEAMTWSPGWELSYRTRLGVRWGLRAHLDLGSRTVRDSQTWAYSPTETDPILVVRDEQTVTVKHQSLGCDLVFDGAFDPAMWTVFVGGQVYRGSVAIDYEFDGETRYAVESEAGIGVGLGAGASIVTPIAGTLGIRVGGGYRFGSTSDLKISGTDWLWVGRNGQAENARLQFAGAFASLGLEYFY